MWDCNSPWDTRLPWRAQGHAQSGLTAKRPGTGGLGWIRQLISNLSQSKRSQRHINCSQEGGKEAERGRWGNQQGLHQKNNIIQTAAHPESVLFLRQGWQRWLGPGGPLRCSTCVSTSLSARRMCLPARLRLGLPSTRLFGVWHLCFSLSSSPENLSQNVSSRLFAPSTGASAWSEPHRGSGRSCPNLGD